MLSRLNGRLSPPDPRPRVLRVGDDDTEAVLDALGSDTTRALLASLYERPAAPSEVADRVGTSVQNVHYHVEKLEAAGLVEPVDTRYSEKGNEMTIYGPASDPIVLVGDGDHEDVDDVVAALAGAVGLLAVASLLVQVLVEGVVARFGAETVAAPARLALGADGGRAAAAAVRFVVHGVEPGVLFFLVGLLAGAAGYLLWRARVHGPS